VADRSTDRQTDQQTDRQTHATRSVTINRIYVCGTAMRSVITVATTKLYISMLHLAGCVVYIAHMECRLKVEIILKIHGV